MHRTCTAAIFVALALGAPAFAAGPGVELSVFAGYRSGGDFNPLEGFDDFFEPDFEVDDADVYGATLAIPLGENFNLEFLYSHQETELFFDEGLFFEREKISDISVSYLHGGITYEWSPSQVHPFIGIGLGMAWLDPSRGDLDTENRLSGHVSGGVKVYFNDHFGLRVEGRGLWADLAEFDFDDSCCNDYGDNDLYQAEATLGLLFKF